MGEFVQALIILAIVIVTLVALIALALFASTLKEKREEKKLIEKSRRREEIMDRAYQLLPLSFVVSLGSGSLSLPSSDNNE